MKTVIVKFGGGVLTSAERFVNAVNIAKEQHHNRHLVFVVSAIDKTTNMLEQIVSLPLDASERGGKIQNLFSEHKVILDELGLGNNIVVGTVDAIFGEAWMKQKELVVQQTPPEVVYDQVVSAGERASARILYALLKFGFEPASYIGAIDWMRTSDTFKNAEPLIEHSLPLVASLFEGILSKSTHQMVVTEGFVGKNFPAGPYQNLYTTLGREGSDLSAVLLGIMLQEILKENFEKVVLYKNVGGIFTGDPKTDMEATLIPRISAKDLDELLRSKGGQIIHPKIPELIKECKFPIHVKNFFEPEAGGTIIHP